MKPLKYGVLLIIGATLSGLGLEKDNPCFDDDLVPIIEKFEGYESKPYKDIVGIDTIGYGFTRIFLELWKLTFDDIDKETAKSVVVEYCLVVNKNYLDKTFLEKQQRKAVFSFIYNVGEGTYQKSTLNKMAISKPLTNDEVCTQLKRFIYAGGKPVNGLKNRRAGECSIMEFTK